MSKLLTITYIVLLIAAGVVSYYNYHNYQSYINYENQRYNYISLSQTCFTGRVNEAVNQSRNLMISDLCYCYAQQKDYLLNSSSKLVYEFALELIKIKDNYNCSE